MTFEHWPEMVSRFVVSPIKVEVCAGLPQGALPARRVLQPEIM